MALTPDFTLVLSDILKQVSDLNIATKSVTVGSVDREQNARSDVFKVIDKSQRDGRKQSDERTWKDIYK